MFSKKYPSKSNAKKTFSDTLKKELPADRATLHDGRKMVPDGNLYLHKGTKIIRNGKDIPTSSM